MAGVVRTDRSTYFEYVHFSYTTVHLGRKVKRDFRGHKGPKYALMLHLHFIQPQQNIQKGGFVGSHEVVSPDHPCVCELGPACCPHESHRGPSTSAVLFLGRAWRLAGMRKDGGVSEGIDGCGSGDPVKRSPWTGNRLCSIRPAWTRRTLSLVPSCFPTCGLPRTPCRTLGVGLPTTLSPAHQSQHLLFLHTFPGALAALSASSAHSGRGMARGCV